MTQEEIDLKAAYEKACDVAEEKQDNMPLEMDFSEHNKYITNIWKRAVGLGRKYRMIKSDYKMSEIHEYGDHMTLENFIDCCKSGVFIDYDGFGHYATNKEESNILIKPSDIKAKKYREDFTHVVWYNR